jgi:hypothetical protein
VKGQLIQRFNLQKLQVKLIVREGMIRVYDRYQSGEE